MRNRVPLETAVNLKEGRTDFRLALELSHEGRRCEQHDEKWVGSRRRGCGFIGLVTALACGWLWRKYRSGGPPFRRYSASIVSAIEAQE